MKFVCIILINIKSFLFYTLEAIKPVNIQPFEIAIKECKTFYYIIVLSIEDKVFVEKNLRFLEQKFPIGILGVCEENNRTALETFKKSKNAVITCGINNKNTITLSSITDNTLLATLQRSIYDVNGNVLEPCEFKINLTEAFSPFAIMSSVAVLLYNGIIPQEF